MLRFNVTYITVLKEMLPVLSIASVIYTTFFVNMKIAQNLYVCIAYFSNHAT